MREIKFEYGFTNHAPIIVTMESIEFGLDLVDCGKIKYRREFTGLKDKNGVDIYEGDILALFSWDYEGDRVLRKILFEDGCFMASDITEPIGSCSIQMVGTEDCEVIGNIYENQELLENVK